MITSIFVVFRITQITLLKLLFVIATPFRVNLMIIQILIIAINFVDVDFRFISIALVILN